MYAQASAGDLGGGRTKGPCHGEDVRSSSIGRGNFFDRITDVVDDPRLVPGDAAMLAWPMRRAPVIAISGGGARPSRPSFSPISNRRRLIPHFQPMGHRRCQKGLGELGSAGLTL